MVLAVRLILEVVADCEVERLGACARVGLSLKTVQHSFPLVVQRVAVVAHFDVPGVTNRPESACCAHELGVSLNTRLAPGGVPGVIGAATVAIDVLGRRRAARKLDESTSFAIRAQSARAPTRSASRTPFHGVDGS